MLLFISIFKDLFWDFSSNDTMFFKSSSQSGVKTGEKCAAQTKHQHLANAYPQPTRAISYRQGNTVVQSNDKQWLMTCPSKADLITKEIFCCQERFVSRKHWNRFPSPCLFVACCSSGQKTVLCITAWAPCPATSS